MNTHCITIPLKDETEVRKLGKNRFDIQVK